MKKTMMMGKMEEMENETESDERRKEKNRRELEKKAGLYLETGKEQ